MLLLILTVCSLSNPGSCKEERLQFAEGSLMMCMTGSQPYLAQYVEEHPGIRVVRWRCSMGEGARI